MAGFVEVELDEVFDGLDAMVRAGKDLRPVFKAAKADLIADLKDHGEHATGPEGAWPPRSPATVEKILSTGGQRKNLTRKGRVKRGAAKRLGNVLGILPRTWRIRYDRRTLEAISPVSWSAVHQEGGRVGKGAYLPARPFAWVSDALLAKIANRVAEHVEKGWQK